MHIVLFNEYYPPDTSATAKMAALVAEKLAQSHRVTVVAGRPSYDPDEYYPYALLRRDVQNRVEVERVGSTAYPRHQMRRRVSNYLSYLALAVPRAISLRPDLVLAMTDPPVAGIAGAFVARLCRCPFVYNIRDLYPEMAVGGNIVRQSGWIQRWEKLHRAALRQAARVVVLGDDMRERIIAKGIDPDRVAVVRDGAARPNDTAEINESVIRDIRGHFSFVVLHAGNLGFYGAWDGLTQAANTLRTENIGFVFIGDGANRQRVQESARQIPNVRFLPFRPASEIPSVMAAGDLHVITVKRGLEGVVVPSKLFSILAAGKPILVVAPQETDAARIVRATGCGLVADPDDPNAIAKAILTVRDDPSRLAEMGRRAREAAHNYLRENELSRFLHIIEDAAACSRSSAPKTAKYQDSTKPAAETYSKAEG